MKTTKDCEEQALHTRTFVLNQQKAAIGRPVKKYVPKKLNEEAVINRKTNKCFSYGQWGHISKNCEEAKHQISARTAVGIKTNIALLANEESRTTMWILDSGTTEQMTSDRSKFSRLREYETEVANSKIKVIEFCDISFSIR